MGVKQKMIYQKPLTEEDPEGMAHMMLKIDEHGQLEVWEVHFIDDPPGEHYTRLIMKDI